MKYFIILTTLTLAHGQYQQYGPPSVSNSNSQFSQTVVSPGPGGSDGPKVYKHISIHIPPKDEFDETPMKRVIRPMEKPDKIVNIIFVKAPSSSSSQHTEVILPEQNEQKTVVYILVKRPDAAQDIKIRQPLPAKPSKPEVYFIKYARNQVQQNGHGGPGGPQVQEEPQSAPAPQYGPPQRRMSRMVASLDDEDYLLGY